MIWFRLIIMQMYEFCHKYKLLYKKSFTFLSFFYKTGGFGVEKSKILYKYSQILVINMQWLRIESKHGWPDFFRASYVNTFG